MLSFYTKVFWYFLSNIWQFLMRCSLLLHGARTTHRKKRGFDFYLFLFSSSTTVRKSESQGSLQNPEPGSKSDKQFALWKWLTNASKKEERKTVYFIFYFLFLRSFLYREWIATQEIFFINISILTTSLLSYISKFTGTTEKNVFTVLLHTVAQW